MVHRHVLYTNGFSSILRHHHNIKKLSISILYVPTSSFDFTQKAVLYQNPLRTIIKPRKIRKKGK